MFDAIFLIPDPLMCDALTLVWRIFLSTVGCTLILLCARRRREELEEELRGLVFANVPDGECERQH